MLLKRYLPTQFLYDAMDKLPLNASKIIKKIYRKIQSTNFSNWGHRPKCSLAERNTTYRQHELPDSTTCCGTCITGKHAKKIKVLSHHYGNKKYAIAHFTHFSENNLYCIFFGKTDSPVCTF